MSRHTKGPWTVLPEEVSKDYIRVRGTRLGGRYKVANVLCPGAYDSEANETRANAMLIGAAPELLEALQVVRMSAPWSQLSHDAQALIDAAIVKATRPVP